MRNWMTLLKHKEFCFSYSYKSAFNTEDANTLTAQQKSGGAGKLLLLNFSKLKIFYPLLCWMYTVQPLRPLLKAELICAHVMCNVTCSNDQILKPTLRIVLIQTPPHPNSVTLKKEAVSFCETSGKRIVSCDVATQMKVMRNNLKDLLSLSLYCFVFSYKFSKRKFVVYFWHFVRNFLYTCNNFIVGS